MPLALANCYRYQELYCKKCRDIKLHVQESKLTGGNLGPLKRLWDMAKYRCVCGHRRFMTATLPQEYNRPGYKRRKRWTIGRRARGS